MSVGHVNSSAASSSSAGPAPVAQSQASASSQRGPEVATGSPEATLSVTLNEWIALDEEYRGVRIVRETFGRETYSCSPSNIKEFLVQSGLPDEMGILVHSNDRGDLDLPAFAVPDCTKERMDTIRWHLSGYRHRRLPLSVTWDDYKRELFTLNFTQAGVKEWTKNWRAICHLEILKI